MNKFNNLYKQIQEEIATFLKKDNKLKNNSDNISNSSSNLEENVNIQKECTTAGLTTNATLGPGTPETSTANTITSKIPIQSSTTIKNSGITTSDIKAIYTPSLKYNKKNKK